MPGGDRTGPLGEGPKTGGGFGYCGGVDEPGAGYMRPFFGRGFGFGRGRGRGRRRGMGFGQRWGAPVYIYEAPYWAVFPKVKNIVHLWESAPFMKPSRIMNAKT